jgi:phosphopantothenoylcysteine decarboxylase/phosphopantothenate--cysteine ligase
VLQGRHVVLGVSGGIACYKACLLARRLVEAGARVDTIMTAAATEFIRPVTFEALTGRPVLTSLWEAGGALSHVRLGQEADLVVVAPATANIIARVAQGIADDVLSAMLLARTAPLLLAPAMNDEMFAAPSTQANLQLLIQRGAQVVGPAVGVLAEGPSDRPGRMSEPDEIFAAAVRLLSSQGPLAGRHVVVTAGPTREPIDPVRFVTNPSSGRMGYAVAAAAWRRGARVTLVTGPTTLPVPHGVTVVRIETTAELAQALDALLPATDVLVMAAAPADYAPADPASTKRPRLDGALTLTLHPTPDVLLGTQARRKAGSLIVGFALETGDAEAKGQRKLERKGMDLCVVNDATEAGAGFDVETNRVTILSRDAEPLVLPLLSKTIVAERILDAIEGRVRG